MSDKTRQFDISNRNDEEIRRSILIIYNALKEKGYNPISQIVGYILSEDPTYITTHNNARNLMRRIDRFELLQILLRDYLRSGMDA
ncbi:MAG: IreB family regulatory phosphoprotein [Clostridia bacterium]|nr:IreB family regulatory phosphoprotein [Clostridia bacterium]MBQ7248723.1 IreB family regulatory phosphoprotein [Deltaproteobacteria bacterium]